MSPNKRKLSTAQHEELLKILKERFEKNKSRHKEIEWRNVEQRLKANPEKLWSLNEMETSGGEPAVVAYDKKTKEYVFFDCSAESPKGRRSLCYDRAALDSRKEHKPKNSAQDMAFEMCIDILTEEEYKTLHQFGNFDTKTSNWVKTPNDVRELGGAIFCDYRFGRIFTYHNGAESYYAARGFRGKLKV
ncbi:DUF4256 domain-containing protein [Arachidicoccus sp.]|jgi:hypothetical protein|uniref:DUF4256 domain-containing protein n=1 Tax=Arachidicoccus sp. TaxID=1872624 RepID=UPI003D1FA750